MRIVRSSAAALGAACVSLAVFVFLLAEVSYFGQLSWLDRSVNEIMSRQPAWTILLSKGLHYLFSAISLIVTSIALALVLWRRIGRRRAILTAGLMLLGAGLNQLIKLLVARPRPVDAMIALRDAAFPSGHTSATTIFFGIMCMLLLPRLTPGLPRAITISASVFIVALVGFSRLALHVHWLTDVLAGLALGGIVVSIGLLAQRFFPPAGPIGASAARKPR
jgi:membrane-associated phospholipid phosphatase